MLHLEEHRIEDAAMAVLGYTSFPANVSSPFRRCINELGAQFGYQLIDTPRDLPFNFFYTSNISLPKKVLVELGGFREDFPAAAWEDIELAYRATRDGKDQGAAGPSCWEEGRPRNGLRLVYQPRARTLHHHTVTLESFCRRQQTSGRSAAIFAALHPELSSFLGLERIQQHSLLPAAKEWLLYQLVAAGEHIPGLVPGFVYRQLLDIAYLRGLRNGLISQKMSGLTKTPAGG
jgi:GT2 family glycosyltransferase